LWRGVVQTPVRAFVEAGIARIDTFPADTTGYTVDPRRAGALCALVGVPVAVVVHGVAQLGVAGGDVAGHVLALVGIAMEYLAGAGHQAAVVGVVAGGLPRPGDEAVGSAVETAAIVVAVVEADAIVTGSVFVTGKRRVVGRRLIDRIAIVTYPVLVGGPVAVVVDRVADFLGPRLYVGIVVVAVQRDSPAVVVLVFFLVHAETVDTHLAVRAVDVQTGIIRPAVVAPGAGVAGIAGIGSAVPVLFYADAVQAQLAGRAVDAFAGITRPLAALAFDTDLIVGTIGVEVAACRFRRTACHLQAKC
jgi:hypothetical protein